jgi:hypothetical protein
MTHPELRGRLLKKQFCAEYVDVHIASIDRIIRDGKVDIVRLSQRATRVVGDSLADYLDGKANLPSRQIPPKRKRSAN